MGKELTNSNNFIIVSLCAVIVVLGGVILFLGGSSVKGNDDAICYVRTYLGETSCVISSYSPWDENTHSRTAYGNITINYSVSSFRCSGGGGNSSPSDTFPCQYTETDRDAPSATGGIQ